MDADELLEVPAARPSKKKARADRKTARRTKAPPNYQQNQPLYTVRHFKPLSPGQQRWQVALESSRLAFGIGPAGTGKTLFAISRAVDLLLSGEIEKILLARPAVEAEEKLGFLPGDLKDKLDPYLRPLYDAMQEKLGNPKAVETLFRNNQLEIVPLAYMRGRTFKNSAIVLDEMQNATYGQIKMALTRLGQGSSMFVTGDPDQTDLPDGKSGLVETLNRLEQHRKYPIIKLKEGDVQRDPIVADLVSIL